MVSMAQRQPYGPYDFFVIDRFKQLRPKSFKAGREYSIILTYRLVLMYVEVYAWYAQDDFYHLSHVFKLLAPKLI